MREKLGKALALLRGKGPVEGLKQLGRRALPLVAEPNRSLVLLAVDLTDPKNHAREGDRARYQLERFDERTLGSMVEMLRTHAPDRLPNARHRLLQGLDGYLLKKDGEILGHVFFAAGSDDPDWRVHPDLDWLPIRPKADEVYLCDYFVRPDARGAGLSFVRLVQSAHATEGYRRAFGYVEATNVPALFTYRATGWRETGRVTEHKFLRSFALVDDGLFRIHPYWREPIAKLPAFIRPRRTPHT